MRSIKTSINPSKIIFGLFLLLGFTVSSFNAVAQQLLKLHYDKPAQNWNEALPLGNGRLGLMAFGNPEREHLQLNEETVWAGEPGNNVPANTSSQINEIRNLLFQGKNQQAQNLSNQTFPRQAPADLNYGMPYQTVGDLWITFPGHQNYSNYYRDLDISNATSTVSYQVNHTTFTRKVFASLTDDVIVMKITADKPNSINFTLGLSSTQKDHQVKNDGSYLQLSGNSGSVDNKKGKIKFEALVSPVVQGGLVNKTDSSITVSQANSVIFYISIATNFKNYKDLTAEPLVKAKSILNKAIAKKYEEALAAHQKKYQSFFNRVTLELGDSEQSKKTTDVRVREFADHKDPQLVALYFQFGRYLLISSSQPGGQPANLQGIWNDKNSPPWDSKYTVNINTEMNYWPAEITNLSEMHEPLFSMLKDLATTGKESASQMYHARGWNMHHNTDLWRITGIVDGGFYGMWPMGGAWLTQHLWQHYLFTGDDKFLRENYPILKGAAMFYLDVLKEEPRTKWLVMAPSMSPENTYEKNVGVAAGTTMDNQLIFDTFNNLINAAKILKTDGSFSDSVSTALAKMPP
ncbi:MAG: glycoside hydrolase family 95 protein, partial [Pedobacter sp.]